MIPCLAAPILAGEADYVNGSPLSGALPGREHDRPSAWTTAGALVTLIVPTLVVIGVFAAPFVRDPTTLPFGRDTGGYLWRANVAQVVGLRELGADPKGLGDRPGHPIVVGVLRSLSATDPLSGAWIAPGVLAAVIALAAGTLAVDAMSGRRWFAIAAAVGLGSSAFVAWTAVGYASNLLFDTVAVALVAVMLHAMAGGQGAVPASAILLGGGAAIHWMFARFW